MGSRRLRERLRVDIGDGPDVGLEPELLHAAPALGADAVRESWVPEEGADPGREHVRVPGRNEIARDAVLDDLDGAAERGRDHGDAERKRLDDDPPKRLRLDG